METLYRKVAVSERLPLKSGFYFTYTKSGRKKTIWFMNEKFSYVSPSYSPDYWLEEIPDNTQQIEKLEAEKKELLEALERVIIVQDKYFGEQEIHGRLRALCVEIESLIQKHK